MKSHINFDYSEYRRHYVSSQEKDIEQEQPTKKGENTKPLPPIKLEKRIVPEHPYCTNWPVGEKKNEDI